jgi:hypothetical protein
MEKANEKVNTGLVGAAKNILQYTKQLLIDMPVRWSSTYCMLHRAETLKDVQLCFFSFVIKSY